MSNENKSIHEFDFSLICEYFSSVERQGPGSAETTIKALSFVEGLTDKSLIADLGCGTGGQTITLAQHTPGQITGIDLFPDFINQFNSNAEHFNLLDRVLGITIELVNKIRKQINSNAEHFNLQDRVKGIIGSMDELPFRNEELDLIWSEGAIYNIGFEYGLNLWRPVLKKGGYIAVSEVSWFTDERPAEIDDFWMDAYPEINTIPNKLAQMQKAGYIPVACFCIPENCWIEHFYMPQVEAQEDFLRK